MEWRRFVTYLWNDPRIMLHLSQHTTAEKIKHFENKLTK